MQNATNPLTEGRIMNRKALVMVVIIAAMSMAGVAGSEDTPANASFYVGAWGGGSSPPGSFVVYGRETDGVFSVSWKNKEGFNRTITLEKYKEDEVKAKYDLYGPLTPFQRPYYKTTLKRK